MVRIHKFGHLDSGPDSKVSQQKMEEFATTCTEVKKKIAEENLEHAKLDFDGLDAANEENADDDSYDDSWLSQLKANKKVNTIVILTILILFCRMTNILEVHLD